MKPKANEDVRSDAKRRGVFFWEIAEKMGVHESTIIRWFREPFTPERRKAILAAIAEIQAEAAQSEEVL